MLVGRLLGGTTGMIVAFGFAVLANGAAYWFSDRLALRMAHARRATPDEAPRLHAQVERLAERAGVPVPAVYIIDDASPNAFATGRGPGHAAVAVSQGLLAILTPQELYGVLAHELAHIKHRDILISSVAAAIAGAITVLANVFQFSLFFGSEDDEDGGGILAGLVLLILAPIAATVIQLAISRSREYAADAAGAEISGSPLSLASALRRLEQGTWLRPMHVNPSAASMFIVHPFDGGGVGRLFQTHPPIAERIARLEMLAGPLSA